MVLLAGRVYTSLSTIARKIAGASWNGPRFFGLRGGEPAPSAAAGPQRAAGLSARRAAPGIEPRRLGQLLPFRMDVEAQRPCFSIAIFANGDLQRQVSCAELLDDPDGPFRVRRNAKAKNTGKSATRRKTIENLWRAKAPRARVSVSAMGCPLVTNSANDFGREIGQTHERCQIIAPDAEPSRPWRRYCHHGPQKHIARGNGPSPEGTSR